MEQRGRGKDLAGMAIVLSTVGVDSEALCSCCTHLSSNRALHDTSEPGAVSSPRARAALEITTLSVGIEISTASQGSAAYAPPSEWTRWGQLVLGVVCLVTIANLQYGWTLFINP